MTSNSSDAFLQKLAQDIRERQDCASKSDEIVLLEKQGRSSQKMRPAGNLMQVSQTIGRLDISNIGPVNDMKPAIATPTMISLPPHSDKRGASLPPRNLKPPSPRKNFGRLSDSEMKRQQDERRGLYSATLNKEMAPEFENINLHSKFHGTMNKENFLQQITGSAAISNYQRLEERASPTKKRSLLPKMTTTPRTSSRASPMHFKGPGGGGTGNMSYVPIARSPSPARHAHFILGGTPTPTPQLKSVSLDRQPNRDMKGNMSNRSSVTRNGENRYRIQF